MTHAGRLAILAAAAGLAALAACSSSSNGVVRPPATTGSISAAPTTSSTSSTSAGASSASSASTGTARPAVRIVPATGLHDGQSVQVHGSGFTPGEALQVVQCASLGSATGPGDCNLSGMQAVSSDTGGRVDVTLTVLRGPFGANRVVCSGHTKCLVSVTQASLKPTEEADAPITFAQ